MSETKQPDVAEILEKLGGLQFPVLGADPVTAWGNAATMAMLLAITIINTVPPEQHAENWKRMSEWIEKLSPK